MENDYDSYNCSYVDYGGDVQKEVFSFFNVPKMKAWGASQR